MVYSLGLIVIIASYVQESPKSKPPVLQKLMSEISVDDHLLETMEIKSEHQKALMDNTTKNVTNPTNTPIQQNPYIGDSFTATSTTFNQVVEKEPSTVYPKTNETTPASRENSQENMEISEIDEEEKLSTNGEVQPESKYNIEKQTLIHSEKPKTHFNPSWMALEKKYQSSKANYAEKDHYLSKNYRNGVVENKDRIRYVDYNLPELPSHLQRTHEFLEIFYIRRGANSKLPAYLGNVFGLYKQVLEHDPMNYRQLHDTYRIPPDWNDLYTFSNDPAENMAISRTKSNKHLLSLGSNGEIIFVVRDGTLDNGPGDDFVIWGHARCFIKTEETIRHISEGKRKDFPTYTPFNGRAVSGVEKGVECTTALAKVSVSQHNPEENRFDPIEPCQRGSDPMQSKCAGYGLNSWNRVSNPFDQGSGGDRYDLSMIGLTKIKAIKIQDLGNSAESDTPGFDLDAIAILNYQSYKK